MKRKPNRANQPSYSQWIGRVVTIRVRTGELAFPVNGLVVGESQDLVRLRITNGWDLGVYKAAIQDIELNESTYVN